MKGYETIRKDLVKLRDKLLKKIGANLKAERNPGDREVGDFYDDVDIEKDRQLIYTLGEREQAKLNAITTALEKMEEGTYGQCEDCGENINKKRLKIIPFAKFCINCQSEHEERAMYADEPTDDNMMYKDVSMSDVDTTED